MRQTAVKESLLYLTIVVGLALLMHPDLLSAPLDRFTHMSERQNYFHPLLYAFIFYIMLMLLRLILKGIRKIVRR